MRQSILYILLIVCSLTVKATNYISNADGSIGFSWQTDNRITIYTTSGTPISFWSQSNDSSSPFNAYGWSLSPNALYYAISPYNNSYIKNNSPVSSLPITYLSQEQASNNNTAHLGAYDYMTSQATTGDASATFAFNHLGSIVRFAITMPENATLTSLVLSSERKDAFTAEATMDATNNSITATAKDSIMVLSLDNIEVTKGSQLIAYMMVAPGDYSNEALTLTLSTSDNKTSTTQISGCKIRAGYTYPVDVNSLPEFYPVIKIMKSAATGPQLSKMALSVDAEPQPTLNSVIQYPVGYAPDFSVDKENKLTDSPLLGDANNDGRLTMEDARLVVKKYLGISTPTLNETKADINGDGSITIDDANEIVDIVISQQDN